ncbi:aldehyde dehydrogenase family protein [Mucilaginibacter rigui]|uniref:aldehyde dehydrogenase (NAD(+)) n=1 Tax=Mucilaginibacter rigui TaxID=534635 RepID=A0ABR7X7U4_9SPHI|nr:aldehyde dehydrogenase family protein [Mucilaginibacter rigui]MBD1386668.1 aldehyde dehydrogenase family protein [Mucilaginibacter rigui]
MKTIESVYVNGQFIKPHGTQVVKIKSPLDEEEIAQITYADEQDTLMAIEAAKAALPAFEASTKAERISYLKRISVEIEARIDDLITATILEYGAPNERAKWANLIAATTFANQAKLLEDYAFTKQVNESTVVMEPIGIAALFTPWNAVAGSIAIKVAAAIAAGCTVILKPSEFGAWQAQIIMECIAAAGLPAGVVNMVNGDGTVITKPIMESADVTKIFFTGSTVVGKLLARQAVDTMKRVTLELGGKSANIILEDADLNKAIPMALQAAFMNNGQACIAGTRLLVPESRIDEVKNLLVVEAAQFVVGNASTVDVRIGPMASQKQFDRIEEFIQTGITEGAEVLFGGLGKPEGLEKGYYVKPTIFIGVRNDITIARQEIFGPVLSVLTYTSENEAIKIANECEYGLMAYVSSADEERAQLVARQLKAGRVLINTLKHDPMAPFGGFKSSGIGRENGIIGLEEFLEPKTLII